VPVHRRLGLRQELDERVLHHVARPVRVAEQPRRVAGERGLLLRKDAFE
jgi:hypothetical protein